MEFSIFNFQFSKSGEQFQIKSKKIKTRILICSFAYLLICLLFVQGAYAQSFSLGIYPPITQIDATAPANTKSIINLENSADDPVFINISLKAFRALETEDGQIQLLDNFQTFADPLFASRVKILDQNKPIKSLTLSPKQKKNLTMEINIPPNEAKGDYYFTVIFNSTPQSQIIANSSNATGGIAMNVLLSIGPKGKTQGYIQNFSAPLFLNNGPVPFNVEIYNQSDHFITPSGEIIIKNFFGQSVGKVSLLPVNILSNSARKIPDSNQADPTKLSQDLNSYLETLNAPTAVWPEKFLIGPYTAQLTLSLSDSGPTVHRSLVFFAFPVSYLLAIILILAITIFIILRVRRKIS